MGDTTTADEITITAAAARVLARISYSRATLLPVSENKFAQKAGAHCSSAARVSSVVGRAGHYGSHLSSAQLPTSNSQLLNCEHNLEPEPGTRNLKPWNLEPGTSGSRIPDPGPRYTGIDACDDDLGPAPQGPDCPGRRRTGHPRCDRGEAERPQ